MTCGGCACAQELLKSKLQFTAGPQSPRCSPAGQTQDTAQTPETMVVAPSRDASQVRAPGAGGEASGGGTRVASVVSRSPPPPCSLVPTPPPSHGPLSSPGVSSRLVPWENAPPDLHRLSGGRTKDSIAFQGYRRRSSSSSGIGMAEEGGDSAIAEGPGKAISLARQVFARGIFGIGLAIGPSMEYLHGRGGGRERARCLC